MNKLFSNLSILVRKPVVKVVSKPTPMTFIGPGRAGEVGRLLDLADIKKVFVLTDHFLYTSGLLGGILQSIKEHNIEAVIYDGVTPDPTFTVVAEAQKACGDCQAIVAVGGGSVLDTAKAVAASVANGKEARALVGMLKVRRYPLLCIAIPTTSGTGSETTIAAIISDPETHGKKQLLDPKLVPMLAILDPDLTVGLPKSSTAFTTFDALTHALEAYVSGYADEDSRRRARMAIKGIYRNLPIVMQNPTDVKAREGLLEASFLAGTAFTRTYVGYVHAFAHNIGGKFGIPHGLANAVLLPHVMQYYTVRCWREFSEIAIMLGITGGSSIDRANRFVESIYTLAEECGIPARFEAFPKTAIDEVIVDAFKECHGVYPVPRYYTRSTARELLEKVCREA
ncbi:MAG: iron-containing alcohol dehydrogenase [Oscillospiraceae bacterium]